MEVRLSYIIQTVLLYCQSAPSPDDKSKADLRNEIDLLTRLQKETLELATLVGMTREGWQAYDKRRELLLELVKQLSKLEK